MYGLILLTVKDLIVTKFGEKVWRKICATANVGEDYVSSQNYPDETLYALAGAAAKTLEISLASVVEAAGYWFIPYVLSTEYGRILTMAGKSFGECLRNVNAMHGHLRIAHFGNMNMPNIRAVFENERRVKVQYTPGVATRKGLGPLLVGLLYALAEIVYGITEITISPVKQTSTKGYEEYLVVWCEDSDGAGSEDDSSTDGSDEVVCTLGLSGPQLATLFPFHVIFNEAFEVKQWGPSMAKVAPSIAPGKKFNTLFIVTAPANNGSWTIDDAALWQNEIVMGKCGDIEFQGQFMIMKIGKERLVGYFGSPKFKTIDEATSRGLSLTDFAIHDQTKDTLFVVDVQSYAAAQKAAKKEKKKDKERRHKKPADGASYGMPNGAGTASPEKKTTGKPPANLNAPAGPFDPKKTLIGNLFGSKVRDVDPNRAPLTASRSKTKDSDLMITVSHESPSSIGGIPLASPHRHLELSKSTSKTGGVVEEPPVPAGSYLPRLTTAFNEMWIRESWHRFPLTRTILTTAMSLEASDQKPGQNVFLAVSRLAIAKGRLSALIRSVLEIELDSAATGTSSFLRGESPATRIISSAFELSGGNDYLRANLASTVAAIQRMAEAEENHRLLESSQWEKALSPKLLEIAQNILDTIFFSAITMPPGVRRILIDLYDLLQRRLPDMATAAPQVLLFLRFVNPALVSPERAMIGKRHSPGATKIATSVAKAIQALVNSAEERTDSPLAKGDNYTHMAKFIRDVLDESKAPSFPQAPERAYALALATIQEFMIEHLERLLTASQGATLMAKESRTALLNFISVALSEAVLRR